MTLLPPRPRRHETLERLRVLAAGRGVSELVAGLTLLCRELEASAARRKDARQEEAYRRYAEELELSMDRLRADLV